MKERKNLFSGRTFSFSTVLLSRILRRATKAINTNSSKPLGPNRWEYFQISRKISKQSLSASRSDVVNLLEIAHTKLPYRSRQSLTAVRSFCVTRSRIDLGASSCLLTIAKPIKLQPCLKKMKDGEVIQGHPSSPLRKNLTNQPVRG
jgi:hypothetical protein